jgi:hypothetical protein
MLQIEQFYDQNNLLLLFIGTAVLLLQLWMIIESIFVFKKVYVNGK